MSKVKTGLAIGLMIIAGGLWTMQCLSQDRPAGGGPGGGGPGGGGPGGGGGWGGGRFDPERMRQAYAERMKETLGVTDEEWKVLGPRIEKVQTLSMQLRAGGRMGMFGGRGGRGDRPEGAAPPDAQPQPERELSEVEKAANALRETLDNEDATADDIAKKLTALREAREKVKQELAVAQDDLRQLLTARQEAQLVLMGLLD